MYCTYVYMVDTAFSYWLWMSIGRLLIFAGIFQVVCMKSEMTDTAFLLGGPYSLMLGHI